MPEIVANIVNVIDDTKTLASCAQVNRLWAEEAIPCHWRADPPISALLALALDLPDRLQYYANMIVSLGTYIWALQQLAAVYELLSRTSDLLLLASLPYASQMWY